MDNRFFNKERLSKANKADLVKWFFSDFPFPEENFSNIKEIETALTGLEIHQLWKNLIFMSLLFLKGKPLEKNRDLFKNHLPFGGKLGKPESLLKENLSVAFFPLNTGSSGAGKWAFVALFEKSGAVFFNSIDFSWQKEWKEGKSYELALHLAKKALLNNEHKTKLATNWIITGETSDSGQIKQVILGNKLYLPTKKSWLIPFENLKQVSPEIATEKVIRSADTIDTAWNHITEEGVKPTGEGKWPKKVNELHILVGGSIKAQVASILLTDCKKVVLWHSENEKESKIPAKQIESVVHAILKTSSPALEIQFLSSKEMIEAESTLINYFSKIHSTKNILFNVTSGNRLMSYAAQSLARLHPNIELIYRDLDEEIQNKFNILNYREFPPYLGSILGKLPENINSNFLYSRDRRDSYDREDLEAKQFIELLTKGKK